MKHRALICCAVVLAAIMIESCGERGLQPCEGHVDVTGGRVWFRIVGSGTAAPLLLLHGGPGLMSDYFEPLSALADERPVVFYDQLGGGKSDRPDDVSLWTIERFVEELDQVRAALGLKRVHLLGHSWGTMLAVDYMLTGPDGVVSLTLASPALSVPLWSEDAERLRAALPEEVQQTLISHEEAGTTDSTEYKEAAMVYFRRHLCRTEEARPQLKSLKSNKQVYRTMWGPIEFRVTGSLANYDRTDRLREITVPTLFTAGRYDEATPEATAWYQSLVPGASLEIFEESAHMTFLEEPERYVQVIRGFLKRTDRPPRR